MKRYDITDIIRGDTREVIIPAGFLSPSYLTNAYSFVVKATQVPTDSKIIQKLNSAAGGDNTQMTADADGLHIYLLPTDSQDFISKIFYYDIFNLAGETEVEGLITFSFDVQTPLDGTNLPSDGKRYIPYYPGNIVVNDLLQNNGAEFVGVQPDAIISSGFYNKTQIDAQEAALQTNIGSEAAARIAADASLQSSINTILQNFAQKNISTNYTAVAADHFVDCTAGSSGITVTLPTAVGNAGKSFVITKVDNGIGPITINTTSGQTINGSLTSIITSQWVSYTVHSNGSNWIIN